jgi:carbonic anhydrase/acetyltransferase-like protein (isoleucine patch superfamily)
VRSPIQLFSNLARLFSTKSDFFVDQNSVLGINTTIFKSAKIIDSTVGDFSYVQEGTKVLSCDIDKYCSIGGSSFIGLPEHPLEFISTSPVFYDPEQPLDKFLVKKQLILQPQKRTIINADVWIGQGSLVKSGVQIGVGAVIGAGTIVTKDVGPYEIVAGSPSRLIRYRFEKALIQELLESKWWEMSTEKLEQLSDHFNFPEKFLLELRKIC